MKRWSVAIACLLLVVVLEILLYRKATTGLDELPNMIEYQEYLYGYGQTYDWPGGTPTSCDDLTSGNVVALEEVGFLGDIEGDLTGSLGQVRESGSIAIYTGLRSPARNTTVIVAEPTESCFVVYAPMP